MMLCCLYYIVFYYISMYNSFFYTFLLHLLVNNTVVMDFLIKYLQVDIAGLCVHTFFIMHSEFTCILSCDIQNDNVLKVRYYNMNLGI